MTHSIPLPSTFEEYLNQFSSKKKFNIKRQIRLLKEHFNEELILTRIESTEQVPVLTKAIQHVTPADTVNKILSDIEILGLARNKLLLSFVLFSGEKPIAVVLSTRFGKILNIHNIFYEKNLSNMSVGASALHLTIQNLIDSLEFSLIDLGFSNPTFNHQSSNLIDTRGNLFVYKKNTIK